MELTHQIDKSLRMDDVNSESFSSSYSHLSSPKVHISKSLGSGLTLVIPSLKSLKASQNSAKKTKSPQVSIPTLHSTIVDIDNDTQEKKALRPAKLKPLKEVLAKLISQIKKLVDITLCDPAGVLIMFRKDDYAFFLKPVDSSAVTGYSDIIRFPMDLGTMTDKVNRGKYRSLEDFSVGHTLLLVFIILFTHFQSDFKLVTMNAKIFNPPGSIYHTEADRIEAWGLDHISKAAATVIQNETDWSIDVENEDEEKSVVVDRDDDETADTPMDVDNMSMRGRSASIAPSQLQGSSRRPTRAGNAKKNAGPSSKTLSESLEPDGGLPGSKDGIGAFPAGSDWAKTMLTLKIKG